MMVFDWHKAAQLIKERKPQVASAGLQSDWEWTGGDIYKNGKPIPRSQTYAYLASTWATPELDMDGKVIPCFLMESETPKGAWGSSTYWPPSARKILKD
jgi:hypothetical protein